MALGDRVRVRIPGSVSEAISKCRESMREANRVAGSVREANRDAGLGLGPECRFRVRVGVCLGLRSHGA